MKKLPTQYDKVPVCIRLKQSLLAKLKKATKKTEHSQSGLVTLALKEYFKAHKSEFNFSGPEDVEND